MQTCVPPARDVILTLDVSQSQRYVPHQVEELVALYRGGEAFAEKLNAFFDEGHYNHGEKRKRAVASLVLALRAVE